MSVVKTAIGLGSSVAGAVQNRRASKAAKRQNKFQKKVNEGLFREREAEMRAGHRRDMAKSQVALATSGVDLLTSFSDVLNDQAIQQELEALNLRYEGKVKAMGLEFESENLKNQRRSQIIGDATNIGQSAISFAGSLFGGS